MSAVNPEDSQPQSIPPGLKPHPRVFVFLCILFAVWMVALLVLYVTVIFPLRHPHTHPEQPLTTAQS